MPSTSSPNSVIDHVRETLQETIQDAFETPAPVLIEALPASGKSYGVIKWAYETGNPLTILTARHDVRDQYEGWAEKYGLRFGRVPSQYRDCPLGEKYDGEIARPENAEEWESKFGELMKSYGSATTIHRDVDGLPCQEHGKCPYMVRYGSFEAEDYDVVAGHYHHAHAPYPKFPFAEGRYIENRYVVFDEFPAESIITEVEDYREAVTAYLNRLPAFPYDSMDEVDVNVHMGSPSESDASAIEELTMSLAGELFDADLATSKEELDPNTPALVRAAFTRTHLTNGWQRAALDADTVVVMHGKNAFILQRPPTDRLAESVVALDGTPSPEMWQILLGSELEVRSVHGTDEQRRVYLRDGLGIRFIQTSDQIKPYAKAKYLTQQKAEETDEWYDNDSTARKDMLAYRWIIGQEQDSGRPGFISTKRALAVYDDYGLADLTAVRGHYGDLKGSNEYEAIRFGIVAGCNAPSDNRVKMWGAFADTSLKPLVGKNGKALRGTRKSFGDFGDRILTALRENEVLQVAMRFGRKPKADQPPARVYLHTAAIPTWVHTEKQILRPRLWEKASGMGQLLTVIRDGELPGTGWKSTDAIEAIAARYDADAVTARTTRRNLTQLRESGTLDYGQPTGAGTGSGRAYVYQTPDALDRGLVIEEDGYIRSPTVA